MYQVEYATKAVDNSGTAIGFVCADGVVLAVEKLMHSKLLMPGTSRRLHAVDDHIGLAAAGLVTDARQIVKRARQEANSWRSSFSEPIPPKVLSDRVAAFVQVYTLYSWYRPFGCSLLIASSVDAEPQQEQQKGEQKEQQQKDVEGMMERLELREGEQKRKRRPVLYTVEPSGACTGVFAAAVGKGRQAAKTELEKLLPLPGTTLDCRRALVEAAKVLLTVHDDTKDKVYEIEMSWISEATGWKTQIVPDDVRDAAVAEAKQLLAADADH